MLADLESWGELPPRLPADDLAWMTSTVHFPIPSSRRLRPQRRILDQKSWPAIAAGLTPSLLAEGMGASTFTPAKRAGDPEVDALTATFAHNNGVAVLHETIQYLVERSAHEKQWLTALAQASFPVTVIWAFMTLSRRRASPVTYGSST